MRLMVRQNERAWLMAGALGGALLLLAQSAWWEVLIYHLSGQRVLPLVLRLHGWRTLNGLASILAAQALSFVGLFDMACGAVLGWASALAWRAGREAKAGLLEGERRGDVRGDLGLCGDVARLTVLLVAAGNGFFLLVSAFSAFRPLDFSIALLGTLLNLKVLWGIGLLLHVRARLQRLQVLELMRDTEIESSPTWVA